MAGLCVTNAICFSRCAGAVVNVHTNQVVRVIGKSENTTRFLHVALFQGAPKTKGLLTLVRLDCPLTHAHT
jgi:hypothetical protein